MKNKCNVGSDSGFDGHVSVENKWNEGNDSGFDGNISVENKWNVGSDIGYDGHNGVIAYSCSAISSLVVGRGRNLRKCSQQFTKTTSM